MKNALLIFFMIGFLVSCKKTEIKRFSILSNFKKIEANSSYTIILVQDTINSIEIIGTKKFVNAVQFKIVDETLLLKTNGKKAWANPKSNKIKLVIHVANLEFITLNETCNLSSENELTGNEIGIVSSGKLNVIDLKLNCNTFYTWNNFPCSGTMKLTGNVSIVKLWMVALMAVDAKNLQAQNAIVSSNTKGVIEVRATASLNYSILGQGNIELFGNPAIISKETETGAGKLIVN